MDYDFDYDAGQEQVAEPENYSVMSEKPREFSQFDQRPNHERIDELDDMPLNALGFDWSIQLAQAMVEV